MGLHSGMSGGVRSIWRGLLMAEDRAGENMVERRRK